MIFELWDWDISGLFPATWSIPGCPHLTVSLEKIAEAFVRQVTDGSDRYPVDAVSRICRGRFDGCQVFEFCEGLIFVLKVSNSLARLDFSFVLNVICLQ